MNYYMPESIVINYWGLNQVYITIVAFIMIGFLILYSWFFVKFQIKISKDLNTSCQNPIAIYFDKANRDRCLTEKITKKNELTGAKKNFDQKVDVADANIQKLNQKIKEVEDYYESLNKIESPELKKMVGFYPDLTKLYDSIYSRVNTSKDAINTMVTDFETNVNDNIQLAIDVGNNLVDTLISNTYTKKWKDKRKKLVDSYDKIKKYLNDANIKPYLDKIKENSDNSAKIEKINAALPKKARTG